MSDRPHLKTERLLLRPFRLDDVADVYAYAKDPEWGRYLAAALPQPYTRRDAEEFVARSVLTSWDTKPLFAIVIDGRGVGGIGLSISEQNATAGLHYSIGMEHWGRGLMPEAAKAVIDWGFRTFDLAKVSSFADLRNRRSWRVMEKVGMTREGVLRSHSKVRDERVDYVYYGILREEWDAGRNPSNAE